MPGRRTRIHADVRMAIRGLRTVARLPARRRCLGAPDAALRASRQGWGTIQRGAFARIGSRAAFPFTAGQHLRAGGGHGFASVLRARAADAEQAERERESHDFFPSISVLGSGSVRPQIVRSPVSRGMIKSLFLLRNSMKCIALIRPVAVSGVNFRSAACIEGVQESPSPIAEPEASLTPASLAASPGWMIIVAGGARRRPAGRAAAQPSAPAPIIRCIWESCEMCSRISGRAPRAMRRRAGSSPLWA